MTNRDRIREVRFTLVEQAARAWPREACGMVICRRGETVVWRLENVAEEPGRFLACPRDQFELEQELERPDCLPVATFHSHPSSGPWMSAEDFENALLRQELEHVIVGRAGAAARPGANYGAVAARRRPEDWTVRAWRVRGDSLRFWNVPA